MYPNIELAKLDNDELIYGTYEECEAYAEKKDTWVIRYFDHVNPSTVYNKFTYVVSFKPNSVALAMMYANP